MKSKRMKGSVLLTAATFAVSGLLVSVLGYRQIDRWTTATAWVARSDIAAGTVLSPDLIKRMRLDAEVAENAVDDPRRLIGMRLKNAKSSGQPFSASELERRRSTPLAERTPEGRVLYTLTPHRLSLPYNALQAGDRIDVLVKGRFGVRTVARDVSLVGALQPRRARNEDTSGAGGLINSLNQTKNAKGSSKGTPLVLAVPPETVYPLAAIGEREIVSLVLHGAHEVQDGELLPIEATRSYREVEVFRGLTRERTKVRL